MSTLQRPARCFINDFDVSAKYVAFHANHATMDNEEAVHEAWDIVSSHVVFNLLLMRGLVRARARKHLTPKQMEFFHTAWSLETNNQDPLLVELINYALSHFLQQRPDWSNWLERELVVFADRLDYMYEVCLQDE